MVNHCIRIGLQNNVSSLKKLSALSYSELEQYEILSYYKLCAISKAAGILSARRQSIKRGFKTKNPYMKKRILTSCYGFKIENGILKIPLGNRKYFDVLLNSHTRQVISDRTLKVHSFILTPKIVSITISKDVEKIECVKTAGIDRNLRNLTYGNEKMVIQYDLSKADRIAENTKSIISSFKRNDVRIRKKLYSKYGQRRKNRITHLLHKVSKSVVQHAKHNREAIVFEDMRYIRKLYRKGNGQGNKLRGRMNGWSFAEIQKQIDYKARWEGLKIIQLSKKDTGGTSSLCPRCGKRFQFGQGRSLWCSTCQRWLDRDVAAVMNQSLKGLLRFGSSQGDAAEAMKVMVEKPLIIRVDASKLIPFIRD